MGKAEARQRQAHARRPVGHLEQAVRHQVIVQRQRGRAGDRLSAHQTTPPAPEGWHRRGGG
jgi:hypothetical protein